MERPPRPRRQYKTDRLLAPEATAQEARCDLAVAPFDRVARDMDLKWGVDRLPGLVPVEMAAKYGAALHALNQSLGACDPDATAAHAANCIRGLNAMDVWAEANGKPKASPNVLEYDLDGFRFGILPDDGMDWPAVRAARPDLVLFTLREVAMALKAYHFDHDLVVEAKKSFPGAEITAVHARVPANLDDEIPF